MSLQIGSAGADVEQLQNNLLGLGFYVSIDGIFGTETQQAVKNFQYTWGSLDVDGIVGPMTGAALDSAVNLLLEGQWDASYDPQQAPVSQTIIVAPKTPTSKGATKSISLASIWKNIDWKWILLGIGGAVVITKVIKK